MRSTSGERSKLGAHYTPRAYVERLVVPTIIEPLRADWEEALTRAHALEGEGKHQTALQAIKDFHHRLCTTRVLDPACGTGNFLYVSLELMKRLEGEVLDALEDLGENPRLAMKGETVNPHQFHGLEINPRAVAIADLVLWIGYLKWQLRTVKADKIAEPVLHAYGTIKEQDAILAWDKQELLRDEHGVPLSRWDGVTTKLHPITEEEIPDPRRHGGALPLREPATRRLAGGRVHRGQSALHRWQGHASGAGVTATPRRRGRSARKSPAAPTSSCTSGTRRRPRLLRKPMKGKTNPLRRFGFITTNSVTQTFSRRVIERHARAKEPLSPGLRRTRPPLAEGGRKAAVRIAMTVAARGERDGTLATVERESGLNTDTPVVGAEGAGGQDQRQPEDRRRHRGGPAIDSERLDSSPGVKLHGSGFIVTPQQAAALGRGTTQDWRTTSCLPSRPRHRPAPARAHGDRPLSALGRRGA